MSRTRLPLPRLFAAVLLLPCLGLAAEERASDAAPSALRERLADRLKDDAATLKLSGPRRPDKAASGAAAEPSRRGSAAARGAAKPAKPAAPPAPAPWGYEGDGAPEHWARLAPENRLCAAGLRQSPVDLRDTVRVEQEPLRLDYRAGAFTVQDNGRAIQLTVAPGNALQVMGRRFELQRLVFRAPAESRIAGRSFDMSVQLLHKDAEGRHAVLEVLLDRGMAPAPQPAVQTVLNHLPLERGEAYTPAQALDPLDFLPADRAYFSYMGSLSTPPCTEGVLWLVLRQPVPISSPQLEIFRRFHPMNARPPQPTGDRLIKESS